MSNLMHNYAKQIISIYRAAFALGQIKEEQPYYRIVKMPNEADRNIHFQVIGKNIVLSMLPEKIMRDHLLMGFSRADVAVITHLGTKQEITSELSGTQNKFFKIIRQIFSSGKTKFVIEKESGEVVEHVASELLDQPTIVEKLNGTDGLKVGYAAAEEHYEKLKNIKSK